VLATRFGIAAIDLVHANGWGQMVVSRAGEIVPASLELAVDKTRPLDVAFYRDLQVFFT
jgi:6-phosphofructokinase 1